MTIPPQNLPPDPRIIGTGYAVPPSVRTNDDPIFNWARKDPDKSKQLFQGYATRHFLAPGETVVGLMAQACKMAVNDAGLQLSDIDLLIGDASIGDFQVPNALSDLHRVLGLSATTWPIALTSAFSQFNAAAMIADALIRAGRARNVLIALGDNWTQYARPTDPQGLSAADGAAACVIGQKRSAKDWALINSRTQVASEFYGSMYIAPDEVPGSGPATEFSFPYFHITDKGRQGFFGFAQDQAPVLANYQLSQQPELEKIGGIWADVCLICHQASSVLIDHWLTAIVPAHCVETIAQFANMVHCNTLFNLAWGMRHDAGFTQNWLQTLCLGPDMHANVTLFRRNF